MKNITFYVLCILVSCMAFGVIYFIIPMIASIIDGSPLILSFIFCGILVVVSLLGLQFGKKKTQKILPFICAVITSAILIVNTNIQFGSNSYYKGLINTYRVGLINGFRKTIVPNSSFGFGSFYLCGNEYCDDVIVQQMHYSSINDVYKIYALNGQFLGQVTGSLENEGLTIQRRW